MMTSADYAAANAAWKKFRSALTRATNKRDWAKVLVVAKDAEAFFDHRSWPLPDDWARFERAKDDATFHLRKDGW